MIVITGSIVIAAIIILLLLLSIVQVYGQTTTTINTTRAVEGQEGEDLPTGHKSVPIVTVTTNGTLVEQAAPAEAIMALVNTIFAITLPAVSGFIIAIVAAIKAFSKNKRLLGRIEGLESKVATLSAQLTQLRK